MKVAKFSFLLFIFFNTYLFADNNVEFEIWKNKFKTLAIKKGISENTFNIVMSNAKFLPDVIRYDRYQPEFYEDTKTYVGKRSNKKKVIKGKRLSLIHI